MDEGGREGRPGECIYGGGEKVGSGFHVGHRDMCDVAGRREFQFAHWKYGFMEIGK